MKENPSDSIAMSAYHDSTYRIFSKITDGLMKSKLTEADPNIACRAENNSAMPLCTVGESSLV